MFPTLQEGVKSLGRERNMETKLQCTKAMSVAGFANSLMTEGY